MAAFEEIVINAAELEVELDSLSRKAGSTVEEQVVRYYAKQGWLGSHTEGNFLSLALKCVAHPLVKPRHSSFHASAASVFLQPKGAPKSESLFSIEELHSNVSTTSASDALQTFDGLSPCSGFYSMAFDGRICRDTFAHFISHHRQFLLELTRLMFVEYRLHTFEGFPDVTLWDDEKIWLIEIKTPNDRLRASQIDFFDKVAPHLSCRTSVLRVQG